MQHNIEENQLSLLEYWKILKRRRYLFILPALAVAVGAVFFALSQPEVYRSEATILIEDQEIPEDIVGATISSYASQQVQTISQRILTIANIQKVVDKFDVYTPGEPGKSIPPSTMARKFRRDMELDFVIGEIFDRQGRSVETAVAFTLAFTSPDPEIAQQVTEELIDLFLSENRRSSADRTSGVSETLTLAVKQANEELLKAEGELADFKVRHEGALPELHELNLGVINRAENQLSDVSLRLQELQQRKLQLATQLSALSPSAPVTLPSGETIMSDRERLRALLIDFRRKSAVYEAGHPDLVRLEREIETLRKTVGGAASYELFQEQLRQERERLAGLRERYSRDHPDIKSSEAAIEELEAQLAAADRTRDTAPVETADNPAYVLTNTQLQSTELEIRSLIEKRRELQATIAEHESYIKEAPRIEMEYEAVLRNYENAKTKHGDLQAKLRAAQVAADVGQEITGQRFTLIEPPVLPIKPEDQNQSSIVLLGLLLAVGVGSGFVTLAEFLDHSIRSARAVAKVAGAPPLVVIPYIDNSVDISHARARRIQLLMALVFGTALLIFAVSYLS